MDPFPLRSGLGVLAIPFADRGALGLHSVTSHWAERVVGATGEPPVASKPNDIWLLTAAWTSHRHFALICCLGPGHIDTENQSSVVFNSPSPHRRLKVETGSLVEQCTSPHRREKPGLPGFSLFSETKLAGLGPDQRRAEWHVASTRLRRSSAYCSATSDTACHTASSATPAFSAKRLTLLNIGMPGSFKSDSMRPAS